MKYIITIILFAILPCMTGLDLAIEMEKRPKPLDISSKNSMEIIKKNGKKRILKLLNKSKDNSKKQMLWFLEPKDDYGFAFLKIETNGQPDYMTMWLPGFKKHRRIQSQNKSDSFLGSDLSYEDMTNRDTDEYDFTILDDNVLCKKDAKEKCYILSSKPKDQHSEYSEHKTWVSKDSFLAVKEESFDKKNQKLKYKEIEYKLIDNFYIMNFLSVKNVQKNTSTVLISEDIIINNGYNDDIFHPKSLKRVPRN